MTWSRGRNAAHVAAVAELRQREDDAPRLQDAVPQLRSLRLHVGNEPAPGQSELRSYTKPVVVASAPAHFELHCMEARCDGYHDITSAVLSNLRAGRESFSGTSTCHGMVGDAACDRVLAFSAEATYEGGLQS